MDFPAAVHPPDQPQIEDGTKTARGSLNEYAFHLLAILLGLALALM